MGEHTVNTENDSAELQHFMQKILDDVRALEKMLEDDLFEKGVTRIGAEQEIFIVNPDGSPSLLGPEVLEEINDPHFTTELARFNLECNLDPVELGPTCLSQMEGQLNELLDKARAAADKHGAKVALTGILPTLDKHHLSMDNMAPVPRYFELAAAMQRLRGADFNLHIKGRDEITVQHDSVMFESANTSFQFHFQVQPSEFARLYNVAQLITAPVLAAGVNSPLLFGRQLWHETRIAVFRQSIDTRHINSPHRRDQRARVSFGDSWLDDSVLEIFRDDIARFRLLLACDADEKPFDVLAEGGVPKLKALRLHNSTVYRWNRPCYGISDGKPHLRIENRVLPSGPSTVDEMANGAFWIGLIKAFRDEYDDVRKSIEFDAVRSNFLNAARLGLDAQFQWLDDDRTFPARELILQELIPRARQGLEDLGIGAEDRDRYMDVLSSRVLAGRTGAQWAVSSLAERPNAGTASEHLADLVTSAMAHQEEGTPVHEWPLASFRDSKDWVKHYKTVGSLMTTDLFTVAQDEVIDLVACLMDWRHIRHVPVEDEEHRLVGLVTHRTLLRVMAREYGKPKRPIPVKEIMHKNVVTITPETSTLDAIGLMKKHQVACLPIVEGERLVGIISERDFFKISDQLLESFLSGESP